MPDKEAKQKLEGDLPNHLIFLTKNNGSNFEAQGKN